MPDAKSLPEPEIIPPGASSQHSHQNPHQNSDQNSHQNSKKSARANFEDFSAELNKISKNKMTMPRATYALYAIAVVTGVPMLIGLIMAYLAKSDVPAWLETHYSFLIRTFWYGMVLILIGFLTFMLGVGMFILGLMPIWYVVRIVRGWMLLENQQPIPNPKSWLFS
ncbi:MAG: hypothetical protein JKY92_01715 [Magnetovibrio sp.]|nr:hypothetical protein [Magnetovibrio sp.]